MIHKILLLSIATFLEDIYQKSAVMCLLTVFFYILHQKIQPYVTENLNKLNLECDLSLIFIILLKIFSNNGFENKTNYYFNFILILVIKINIIFKILSVLIQIFIYKNKDKIIKKFKRIKPYITNSTNNL